jgi:hypothetical protein
MSAGKLLGVIAVVAVIVFGLMSGHMQAALHALHATHGVWIMGKIAIFVLSGGGLLVARAYKALRPDAP